MDLLTGGEIRAQRGKGVWGFPPNDGKDGWLGGGGLGK